MEEQYWQRFMKSGDVTDYLCYKMEMYGHHSDPAKMRVHLPDAQKIYKSRSNNGESDHIDRNGAFDHTDWRI